MKIMESTKWEELVELYKSYDGRIVDFCKLHIPELTNERTTYQYVSLFRRSH